MRAHFLTVPGLGVRLAIVGASGTAIEFATAIAVVIAVAGCGSGRRADETPATPSDAPAPERTAPANESPPPAAAAAPAPIVNAQAEAAHAAAMARFVGKGPPLPPLVPPDATPPEQPGAFVPIIDSPQAPALARFHAALRALASGSDPDAKVRVLMYGASGTAADLTPGYVRTYLQTRFGDGGPGFVPIVPLSKWYRHSEVTVEASKHWTKEHAQIKKGRLDGHWGLLGASFYTTKNRARAQTAAKDGTGFDTAELFFLQQPTGGRFDVLVDGKLQATVTTRGEAIGPGYHPIALTRSARSVGIQTKGDGEVRVFGAVLERKGAGIVVDTLGIDGTRSANHLMWNEALWLDNVRRRAPDLVVFSYGTNESTDEDEPMEAYEDGLRTVVQRVRTLLPDTSCVLLGPGDYPMRTEDGWAPRPRLLAIHSLQRQVAAEVGCGFWDGMAFMGGPGTMPAWVNADPPLARSDYLHFNGRGAARKGQALCDALMLQYDSAAE